MRTSRSAGSAAQHVVDADHRCNYIQVPYLALDAAAAGVLRPASVLLYLHYRRVAWEQHGQLVIETLRETQRRTGLSHGTILNARGELETAGWLTVVKDGHRGGQEVTVTILDRWEENCRGHGQLAQKLSNGGEVGQKPANLAQKSTNLGRNLSKSEFSDGPYKTFVDREDSQGASPEPGWESVGATPRASGYTPEELLAGLARGLGRDPIADYTDTERRRQLAIARDLAAIGATPAELEDYAREVNVPGRIAAVDMKSFEHERPSWLARRHHREPSTTGFRVINGRIPE
jgi:hypothetical protein